VKIGQSIQGPGSKDGREIGGVKRVKPDSPASLAVSDIGSEINLQKIAPRNRLQTGKAQVGQAEPDYAGPSLPFEKVEDKIVGNGR
jgi:hypothetical protein